MQKDPIIETIRKIRHEIEDKCQNDSQRFFDHYLEVQKEYSDRLVCLKPKPSLKMHKAV